MCSQVYKIAVQQVAATMPLAAVHRTVENRTAGIQFTLARGQGASHQVQRPMGHRRKGTGTL